MHLFVLVNPGSRDYKRYQLGWEESSEEILIGSVDLIPDLPLQSGVKLLLAYSGL